MDSDDDGISKSNTNTDSIKPEDAVDFVAEGFADLEVTDLADGGFDEVPGFGDGGFGNIPDFGDDQRFGHATSFGASHKETTHRHVDTKSNSSFEHVSAFDVASDASGFSGFGDSNEFGGFSNHGHKNEPVQPMPAPAPAALAPVPAPAPTPAAAPRKAPAPTPAAPQGFGFDDSFGDGWGSFGK